MGTMFKPTIKGAALVGGALLSAGLLAGCAGQKLTYSGMEVASLDKGIEALDKVWAAQRANGTASNVDKESRCYAQISGEVLAEKAICGPIHYLGQDAPVWESVAWQPSGEGKDKVQVSPSDSFSTDAPAANTQLYRTDGKKAPEKYELTEPDTKTASATQAIWGLQSVSSGQEDVTVDVVTPESTITVKNPKVSDRIGGESDRVKAGDGHKFGSVTLDVRSESNGAPATSSDSSAPVLAELAFVSGGKTYPLGKAKSGTVGMAVPGDGADLSLAVTYEGLTQTISLADAKMQSKATAFYDDFSRSTSHSGTIAPVKIGKDDTVGDAATFTVPELSATRTAYDPKAGWAPEGKAWLVVKAKVNDDGPVHRGNGGDWGKYTATYDAVVKVTSATVKNISGTEFTAPAKRSDVVASTGWFSYGDDATVVFEVPANVGDFSVDLGVTSSGPKKDGSDAKAPANISVAASFKGIEFVFDKK